MVSSVAIADDLRRRLKILAAKYDTTQAEIIKKAIALLEAKTSAPQKNITPKVLEVLDRASERVVNNNSRRKRIYEALGKPGIDIDDLRVEFDG